MKTIAALLAVGRRAIARVRYHARHFEPEPLPALAVRPLDSEADAEDFVGELREAEHETPAQLECREWTDADYANAFSALGTYLDGFLSRRLPLVLPEDFYAEANLHAFRTAERPSLVANERPQLVAS